METNVAWFTAPRWSFEPLTCRIETGQERGGGRDGDGTTLSGGGGRIAHAHVPLLFLRLPLLLLLPPPPLLPPIVVVAVDAYAVAFSCYEYRFSRPPLACSLWLLLYFGFTPCVDAVVGYYG